MPIEWTPFTRQGRSWSMGTFRVIKLGSAISLPEAFREQKYMKLKNESNKLICFKFGKNGNLSTASCVGTGSKTIIEFFGEDEENLVGYLAEDAIYLAPYSRGQEYLEKILKRETLL